MNKECRQIWTGCFAKCKAFLQLCKPPPRRLRAETEMKDSRCSSTLTVISCDHRGSELSAVQAIDNQAAKVQPHYLMHKSVARLKEKKPRASTLSLPAVMNQRLTVTNPDIQIRSSAHAQESDLRSRCNSVPLFLHKELEIQVANEQKASTYTSSLSPLARELSTMMSTNSEDSDANSETDNFIQENYDEISSKL